MAINTKHPLPDVAVSGVTRESRADDVRIGAEQRPRPQSQLHSARIADQLIAIGARVSARPRLTTGDADEALGYGADGLPD